MRINIFRPGALLPMLVCLLTAFAGFDVIQAAASDPPLEEFGYNTMRMWGTPATKSRPLLIVLVDFTNSPPFAHPTNYYNWVFFNPTNPQGVQGYFRENSHDRFNWVPAGPGVVGPVHLGTNDRAYSTPGFEGFPYDSNLVYKVMRSGVFDFKSYDANTNRLVTPNELTIAFVSNDEYTNPANPKRFDHLGANRDWEIRDPVADYSICWEVFLSHRTGLLTTAHELCHALGALECYGPLDGCPSQNLTVMSCTSGAPDDPSSVHLDPWHKMRLGWCKPRIHSLPAGGITQLPAAQVLARSDAPLLLYDPARGTNDYFLLEYRTPFFQGSLYDADLANATNGLVIWHVGPKPGSGVPVATDGPPGLTRGSLFSWPSGAVTPLLAWLDGSPSPAVVSVWPFTMSDDMITVEWLVAGDTWVDFDYTGGELGTFFYPYNSFAEGVAAVP
jgi:M6 family metalloprotease-like protein